MLLDLLALVGGLALLTAAADRFVLGAARLAIALRISPVLIGAVVIGFGTSAPELLVTALATLAGSQDLAMGNVVGSNTANVLLVLGVAGLIQPIAVRPLTLRRELPLMLAAVALLSALSLDRRVSGLDAGVLLAATVAALWLIVRTARRDREAAEPLEREVAAYHHGEHPRAGHAGLLSLLGLVGTLVGAQLLVDGASGLAAAAGVSEAAMGLSVVAVGTSLPELVTAVVAAWRRQTDLVVGNVLGSNLFNSLPVAGVAGALDTARLAAGYLLGVGMMLLACALTAVFLRSGHRVARTEGGVLLALFVVSLVLTFALG